VPLGRATFILALLGLLLKCPLLGVDLDTPQLQSFVVILTNDVFVLIINANLMIRAVVEKL